MGLFRPKTILESIKVPFLLLKISGYEFFSIKVGSNNELTFYQSWSDVLIFIISLSYSVAVVFKAKTPSFDGLKSKVLMNGMKILFRALMTSIIYTKIKKFCLREESFKSLVKMIQIETKVT